MLKRLLVLDGVVAVCRFQDDGSIIEGLGALSDRMLTDLARFAHWYRRVVSAHADAFALFSQMNGWTPARGWIVEGSRMSVLSLGNVVAMVDRAQARLNEVMAILEEVSHE